jgi:hypothetical protein
MTPKVKKLIEIGTTLLREWDVVGAERAFYRAYDLSKRAPEVKLAAAAAYRDAGWPAVNLPGRMEDAWRIFQNALALYESLGKKYAWEVAKVHRGLSIAAGKLGDIEGALRNSEASEKHARGAKIDRRERDPHIAKLHNDRIINLGRAGRRAT